MEAGMKAWPECTHVGEPLKLSLVSNSVVAEVAVNFALLLLSITAEQTHKYMHYLSKQTRPEMFLADLLFSVPVRFVRAGVHTHELVRASEYEMHFKCVHL